MRQGTCSALVFAWLAFGVVGLFSTRGVAEEAVDEPIAAYRLVAREAGLSLGASALLVGTTSWVARNGRELGFSKRTGVVLGLGGSILVPPVLTTALLRWLGPDEATAGFWKPFVLSLAVRTVSLVGIVATEIAFGNNADSGFLPGLLLGGAIGGMIESLVLRDWGSVLARSRVSDVSLTIGGLVAVPSYQRSEALAGMDIALASNVNIVSGHSVGVRLHGAAHRRPLDGVTVHRLVGNMLDASLRYRWMSAGDHLRSFASIWGGGFYDTACLKDVCGALGPTAGAELGIMLPTAQQLPIVASLQYSVARVDGALGTFWILTPAIEVGVAL